jgi:transcriptional regulator with XRE-family HTH domain
MTDYDDLVARNVKRLRGERNLSMAALAAQAGLSKQTLSKIEQGQGNPTLGTLEAISMALGTTARALITEWGSSIRVQSALSAQWVPGHDGETRMLEQLYGSGYVRTAIVKLNPALQGPASAALSSGSIHQVFLIEGHAEVGPVSRTVQLTAGDYVKFPADVAHAFKAINGTAVMHLVTSFPQVPQLAAFSGE